MKTTATIEANKVFSNLPTSTTYVEFETKAGARYPWVSIRMGYSAKKTGGFSAWVSFKTEKNGIENYSDHVPMAEQAFDKILKTAKMYDRVDGKVRNVNFK